MAKFKNTYGYFTNDGQEYVITRPDTPKPWVNVISNGEYGFVISQAGGGFSWSTHSNFNRLTRWHQDLVQDNWGKFLYLRDADSGHIWSPSFQPVKNPAVDYECRHGIGYSVLSAQYQDIKSEWTLFAAENDPLEIWILRLTNLGPTARRLQVFSYLEWCLGFAPDSHREFHKAFIETCFDDQHRLLTAEKRLWEVADDKGRHWNRDWPYIAFHAVSDPVSSYDGDKEAFIGNYGDLRTPAAVARGKSHNSEGKWGDAIGSLNVNLEIPPHQSHETVFVLGLAKMRVEALALLKKYLTPSAAHYELGQVQSSWSKRLSACHVDTPDDAFDFMTNTWLKYQTISCRLWGRAAYYQQSGAYGFRDQLQDSLIFLPLDPSGTRKQILLHAAHQFKDGSVYHWWHPFTETGLHNNVSDNLLWLPYVIAEYIKETGDYPLLDEKIPFVDDATPTPLWEHCRRALKRALKWRSKRGLPLIGDHDWNDGLNAVGNDMKGESVWMAHFLHKILMDFEQVAIRADKKSEFAFCSGERAKIKKAVNAHAWDGRWYWRATKDNGEIIGTHLNKEGKIFLNAQTWSIIAQTAPPERAAAAMQSVEELLDREYGPLLFWPAFSRSDSSIGYLSRYAPGRRENGGLYTHAATWAVLAEALLGNSEKAWQMYKKFNPITRSHAPDIYHVEPYVTPGNVEGPDSPLYGRGGWTWYTGSASWLFKVSLDGILGVRADFDGLVLDPCIPKSWSHCSLRRTFRGAIYLIRLNRKQEIDGGITSISIDGISHQPKMINGKIVLPIFPANEVHQIDVTIG